MTEIDDLAARIEAHLAEDEAAANAATPGPWLALDGGVQSADDESQWPVAETGSGRDRADRTHIARSDPARALRRVKAVRELVASILAEGHHYEDSDYYCCSQARDMGPIGGPEGPPGSGCSDRERAGNPCDCGRDALVARRLAIIASEWGPGA